MWKGLGAASGDAALFHELIGRYAETHRRYHTMQHLDECFAWLPVATPLAEHPYEIELALWFHDAIYERKAQDNEQKSAEWAKSDSLRCGLAPAAADWVYELVTVTRHDAIPEGRDAMIPHCSMPATVGMCNQNPFSSIEIKILTLLILRYLRSRNGSGYTRCSRSTSGTSPDTGFCEVVASRISSLDAGMAVSANSSYPNQPHADWVIDCSLRIAASLN